MSIKDEIREELFKLQDIKYRDFQVKLIPGREIDSMIGVRTPALRALAKKLQKRDDTGEFLEDLPHKYFDEDQLHAFIISGMKDYEKCVEALEAFLPFVNNWATCDQMSPSVFKKNRDKLTERIETWLDDGRIYVVRFGIGMLMEHYLDADFKPEYPKRVAKIVSDEYYINMMSAWYFATALAKQYDAVIPYITEHRLPEGVHNRAIQKAVESRRITPEQKEYLKTFRVKKK